MVRVIIPSLMRPATEGAEIVEVDAGTLKEVVERLVTRFPKLGEALLDEQGDLRHYVALFVDGVEVRARDGLLHPVAEGAEVVIVPALSGGC